MSRRLGPVEPPEGNPTGPAENRDPMEETEAERLNIQQPLEILRSSVRRLMDRQIPASPAKLEELYAHIKGAVSDSVATISDYVGLSLGLNEELLRGAQLTVEQVNLELDEALHQVKKTFFAATTFQQCQENLPNLALFESRLEESLLRLKEAGNPTYWGPSMYVPAPTISNVLEALGESLDQIHRHIRDGSKEPLRLALEAVQRAKLGLTTTLEDDSASPRATRPNQGLRTFPPRLKP